MGAFAVSTQSVTAADGTAAAHFVATPEPVPQALRVLPKQTAGLLRADTQDLLTGFPQLEMVIAGKDVPLSIHYYQPPVLDAQVLIEVTRPNAYESGDVDQIQMGATIPMYPGTDGTSTWLVGNLNGAQYNETYTPAALACVQMLSFGPLSHDSWQIGMNLSGTDGNPLYFTPAMFGDTFQIASEVTTGSVTTCNPMSTTKTFGTSPRIGDWNVMHQSELAPYTLGGVPMLYTLTAPLIAPHNLDGVLLRMDYQRTVNGATENTTIKLYLHPGQL